MKKFVILLLICLCFLLCSCSADTSGYQNELTCTDWSAELDGGGKINLSFDGGNASLIMMSGKDKAELCGKYVADDTTLVIFVPKLYRNYTFEYIPHGKSLICYTTVQKLRSAVPITRKNRVNQPFKVSYVHFERNTQINE